MLHELLRYSLVCACQMSMILLYPLFYSAFTNLGATAQTYFVLLLPVLKLIEKNLLSWILNDRDDIKPELVIFNVEIFNALFVSCCMQSSTSSIRTSIAVMAVDFVQCCVSLQDLNAMLADVDALADKMHLKKDQLIVMAMEILALYPTVAQHRSLRHLNLQADARTYSANTQRSGLVGRSPSTAKYTPPKRASHHLLK